MRAVHALLILACVALPLAAVGAAPEGFEEVEPGVYVPRRSSSAQRRQEELLRQRQEEELGRMQDTDAHEEEEEPVGIHHAAPRQAFSFVDTEEELVAHMTLAFEEILADKNADVNEDEGQEKVRWITYLDLESFAHKVVNPDGMQIYDNEKEIVKERMEAMVQHEGLGDVNVKLYRGFLARGHPMHFFRTMWEQLKDARQERRRLAIEADIEESLRRGD